MGSNSGPTPTSPGAISRLGTLLARSAVVLRSVRRANLRPDVLAGLTVAIVAIPQSSACAIAGLPPATGLFAAGIASVVGALWGPRHTSPPVRPTPFPSLSSRSFPLWRRWAVFRSSPLPGH